VSLPYDALLFVSFGGPEKMEDVLPFLENVLRGKPVPRERMLEVAHHYEQFGGISPLNAQNRALIAAVEELLHREGPNLPIYFGNRNWHPLLTETLRDMAEAGVRRALAFVTSAYSSYSGCRQYRENIAAAQAEVGPNAPSIDKVRVFYNHPLFIEAVADRIVAKLQSLPEERRAAAMLVFTAHSIPTAMANNCQYVAQLTETCRLTAELLGHAEWKLVYQSRSGPPTQPWLEPDVCDYLRELAERGVKDVVLSPVGFLSDHMEILFDLDTEARDVAAELGMNLLRAETVGTHPKYVAMIRELILERLADAPERRAIGRFGANHDVCPEDCCLSGRPMVPAGRG
jgi:ferrochelatase